jgi:hypothetical protein
MFVDNYINLSDSEALYNSYVNSDNYVSVDQEYLTQVNFFVRKMLIEGQANDEGFVDATDVHTS